MNLPQKPANERRASDRRTLRASALLKLPAGQVVEARTLDIGKGGVGLVSDFNIVVGATVAVRITLPASPSGNAFFEATATVANCTLASKDGGFRLGLHFQPLSAAASAALQKLIA